MANDTVSAVDLAHESGLDEKAFRQELRDAGLTWHAHNERWEVRRGSSEHDDMLRVRDAMLRKRGAWMPPAPKPR